MNCNSRIQNHTELLYDLYDKLLSMNDSSKNKKIEIILDSLIMNVKINFDFQKELLEAGYEKRVSHSIVFNDQYAVRFKIKNCTFEEYDTFVKTIRNKGLNCYIYGRNIRYEGPESCVFIPKEDFDAKIKVDGEKKIIHFKKDEITLEFHTAIINYLDSAQIINDIDKKRWSRKRFVKKANEEHSNFKHRLLREQFPKKSLIEETMNQKIQAKYTYQKGALDFLI